MCHFRISNSQLVVVSMMLAILYGNASQIYGSISAAVWRFDSNINLVYSIDLDSHFQCFRHNRSIYQHGVITFIFHNYKRYSTVKISEGESPIRHFICRKQNQASETTYFFMSRLFVFCNVCMASFKKPVIKSISKSLLLYFNSTISLWSRTLDNAYGITSA